MNRIIKSFSDLYRLKPDLPFHKDASASLFSNILEKTSLVAAKTTLPANVTWLKKARKQQENYLTNQNTFNADSQGAANYLHAKGIHHLWHLTDRRNLNLIHQEKGLLSYIKLTAANSPDIHFVSNEFSRNCDAHLNRNQFIHLSFTPNSWFFHRAYKSCSSPLVWLRFSTHVLALPEVTYTCGNAASGAVKPNADLARVGIDWELIKNFIGAYSDDKGPTNYFALYNSEIGRSEAFKRLRKDTQAHLGHLSDQAFFNKLSRDWNSEVLIKDFLPLALCSGVYDCRTGKSIQF